MPVIANGDGARVWMRRTTAADLTAWCGWLAGVALTVLCFQFISDQTIWAFVWDAPRQAADLLDRAFPPRWAYVHQLWRAMWDTINIATLGTVLAIAIGVPVAFLAAHNTTPSVVLARAPRAVHHRRVASRSVNSLIWALILVIIFGPGMFAGILAIGLRSIGFIGKLLYEAIAEIDASQVEAVTATGGIGMQLQASIITLAWPQVTMILLLILGTVVVSEWLSARVRRAII
jgi:phosphonate transport system permease protein